MSRKIRKLTLIALLAIIPVIANTQEPVYDMIEQWSEETGETAAGSEYLEMYEYYRENKININDTTQAILLEMNMLSESQWRNLKSYIEHYGILYSKNELALVNGFDIKTIQRISPIIIVTSTNAPVQQPSLKTMLTQGSHNLLAGSNVAIEDAVGYQNGHYEGSNDRVYFRYYYKYKENIKLQLSAEKPAGAAFTKEGQLKGFDYYGSSLLIKNIGRIKAAAIGQYQLQFGQGTTLWTGFNPYAGATTNISRYGQGIRSAGAFNRNSLYGAAITLSLNSQADLTAFYAHHSLAGLHMAKRWRNTHVGTTLWSDGTNWNGGIDGRWIYKRLALFGEASLTTNGHLYGAIITGGEYQFDNNNRFSMYYRYYSPYYSNHHSASLGQNSQVKNENGLCMNIQLTLPWNLSAYGRVDMYRFPTEKYQVAAPSTGNEMYLLLTRPITAKSTIELCYRNKERGRNNYQEETPIYHVEQCYRQQAEARLSYIPADGWTLATRAIQTWYHTESSEVSHGFAISQDIRYRAPHRPLTLSARYVLFDIDDYDSRIIMAESDFIYESNSTQLMNKGYRFYLWAKYELGEHLSIGLRYSISQYANLSSISSGHDKIESSHKQNIKLQVRVKF